MTVVPTQGVRENDEADFGSPAPFLIHRRGGLRSARSRATRPPSGPLTQSFEGRDDGTRGIADPLRTRDARARRPPPRGGGTADLAPPLRATAGRGAAPAGSADPPPRRRGR